MSAKIAESLHHVRAKLLPVSRSSTASVPDHHDDTSSSNRSYRSRTVQSVPSSISIHPSIVFSAISIPHPPYIFFSLSFHALCASGEFPLGLLPSRHRAFPPLSFLSPYPRSLNPSPTGCISQPSRFPISPRNLIYVVIHTKKPLPPFPSLV